MKHPSICWVMLACLFALFAPASAQDLQISFGEKGLASIKHFGVELLDPAHADPNVQVVRFPTADGNFEQLYAPPVTKQTYDVKARVLTQEYSWGTVAYAYAVHGARLDMTITATNTTQKTIGTLNIYPIKLLLPHCRQNRDGGVYVDDHGVIAVLNWEFTRGLGVGNWFYEPVQNGKQVIPLSLSIPEARVSHHPVVDNEKYFNDPGRPLAPGKSDTYKISLAFGQPGSSAAELAPDFQQAYAKALPMQLQWPDRRPIGTVFYAHPFQNWKTNPRGFNFGKGAQNDITTAEGLTAFKADLLQYGDNCIKILKTMNAQGAIVWDLEGEEFWHPLSYIGDPRMLPQVAPEMDKLADEFLKKFTDAGLKIGVTIRPTEVYYREGQTPRFWHRDVKDPVALMSEKIDYAKKRWGATIFYLDSNVFGEGFDTKLPPKNNVPWVMPSSMLQQLTASHPDCLVIPEWSSFSDYRFGAPYSSPNLRQLGTDANTRRIYPTAFRVVAVNSALLEECWDSYTQSVQGGDILLCYSWFMATENELVRLIYREAALRKQEMPTALLNANEQTVLAQARTEAEVARYYAATQLGKLTSAASQQALVALLDDASPLVRKSALTALYRRADVNDPALVNKLGAWLVKPGDAINSALRPFVADLLGHIGDPAVAKLLEILQGNQPQAVPYAFRALSATGTANEQAVAFLMKPLAQEVGKDPNQELAIKVLGDLHVQAAVPALLKVLDDNVRNNEFIRQQAVIALGKIGDKTAIEPLVNHYNRGYSTVVVYSIEATLDTALAALTGEQHLVGKNDWQRWWAQQKPPQP